MNLTVLSDAQLLGSLKTLCGQGRVVLARLLAHLVEVEERRLHLEAACPSLYQFCVQRLGMSEDEACRRIQAARLARRFPELLVRIERGDLTLSTIALLRDALTEATYEELVEAAAGKTKAEVQALLAKRSPKPDALVAITPIAMQPAIPTTDGTLEVARVRASAAAAGPQLVPLSQTRHKVQFTASDELRSKIERAQDLMRHANADGDLAIVVERAMDLLLEKLEKQRHEKTSRPRLGKTSRPRQSPEDGDPASVSRARRLASVSHVTRCASVSRATRRAVFERDGERCTFTDAEGHRCPATTWLELDHVTARARGGTSELGNLRVLCRAHNRLYAEKTFGKEHVERAIHQRRHPRQRGYASESCALAASGLVHMGFRHADVRRALDAVSARYPTEALTTIPVQTILREALAILT
jgi:5-methylcytosine-specific restriction endonuclease McrA